MCLTDYRLIKSAAPITVYKVLLKTEYGYFSPYYPFEWVPGVMNISSGPIPDKFGDIGEGVFHAYPYVEDAIVEADMQGFFNRKTQHVVAKFTIPSGVDVYIGKCCGGVPSYASGAMRFEEIIGVDPELSMAISKISTMWFYDGDSKLISIWSCDKRFFDDAFKAERAKILARRYLHEEERTVRLNEFDEAVKKFYEFKNWIK